MSKNFSPDKRQTETSRLSLSADDAPTLAFGRLLAVGFTSEQQGEDGDELEHGVAQDVLHHGPGDQRLVAAVGFTQQQRLGGRLGGQSERRQRVHDEVDPQHLDGFQRGVLQRRRKFRESQSCL